MINARFFHRASLFLVIVIFSLKGIASNERKSRIVLTDSARISLITCSPGNELYSTFGHSAIRVSDKSKKLDVVFNYGTFNFQDPNFYPNFVRGKLNYILSVYPYRDFEYDYVVEKRWVYEQILNVDLKVKQYLIDSLLINYRPENRFYPYDFFNDNCATRIRDFFVEATHQKITFDYSTFSKDLTYRQLLMPSLTQKPWSKLGINLLLGLPADRVASPWDYMYLPDHLLAAFEHASFSSDSTTISVVQPTKVLLKGEDSDGGMIWYHPLLIFLMALLIAVFLTYKNYKDGLKNLWFDKSLLIFAGLLGALFTFLWIGTAHKSMVWNLNLLWANPFHLIAVFFLSVRKPRIWVRKYLTFNLIVLIALLILWPFLPQALPWVIYPVVLALAIRLYVITRLTR